MSKKKRKGQVLIEVAGVLYWLSVEDSVSVKQQLWGPLLESTADINIVVKEIVRDR